MSVLIITTLDGSDRHPLYAQLLDNCCNFNIVVAPHDQATRHLALCFYLKKDFDAALQLATGIAQRHLDIIDYQILVAQILGEKIGSEVAALQKVKEIRDNYRLSADQEALLVSVEAEIAGRS